MNSRPTGTRSCGLWIRQAVGWSSSAERVFPPAAESTLTHTHTHTHSSKESNGFHHVLPRQCS
jgi:hypothetical protein